LTREEWIKILVGVWAIATVPFFVAAYGFSESFNKFLADTVFNIFRKSSYDNVLSDLLFIMPWIIIFSWSLVAIVRFLKRKSEQ